MSTTRQLLNEYGKAKRDIELTEAAAGILESVTGMSATVRALRRRQHSQLARIDKYAELLGAPYPRGAVNE